MDIQSWIFLPWINQLAVLLGSDMFDAVYPLMSKVRLSAFTHQDLNDDDRYHRNTQTHSTFHYA
jgi:queuine/archaeosine tRNA-ribosyltransferase